VTAAEFDTRRRLLGLSIEETASWCGVKRRTVERWISGYSEVSDAGVERLEELESCMIKAVERGAAEAACEDKVVLIRYRSQAALAALPHASGLPAGAHAMMTGWLWEALDHQGADVEIVWGEP
jgi:transcriptional regulator with XRE-family HTH domain